MGYVTGMDSRQMILGVWSIEDEVLQDSPARFIEILPQCKTVWDFGLRSYGCLLASISLRKKYSSSGNPNA